MDHRPAFAHAVVGCRPDVEALQMKHHEHLRSPWADAAHLDQSRLEVVVGQQLHVSQRNGPIEDFLGEVGDRGRLRAAETRAAHRTFRERERGGRRQAIREELEEPSVDGCRRGPGELLIHDRPHQCREAVVAWFAKGHRPDPLHQGRHRGVPSRYQARALANLLGGRANRGPKLGLQANSDMNWANWSRVRRNASSPRSLRGRSGICSVVAKSSAFGSTYRRPLTRWPAARPSSMTWIAARRSAGSWSSPSFLSTM